MSRVLYFPAGATKVQSWAINTNGAISGSDVSGSIADGYDNGPCRNRTYNLLVRAVASFRQSIGRFIAEIRETRTFSVRQSSIGGWKGATKVQPPAWQSPEAARGIPTRQLNGNERTALLGLMEWR